jgi:diaminopimelate epimerase
MGNPHVVTFVDDFDFDWQGVGAKVEAAAAFPRRINVEFARLLGDGGLEVKVWERGAGATKACGTGACATAVAAQLNGITGRGPLTVRLPGGDLEIQWREDDQVLMTGPVVDVCRGVYLYGS